MNFTPFEGPVPYIIVFIAIIFLALLLISILSL